MRQRTGLRPTRGLTLLEVVVALGVMVVMILGFASMTTVSVTATRSAKPTMLAQEAAWRLAERMQAVTVTTALSSYWTSCNKQVINGLTYAVDGGGLDEILNGSTLTGAPKGLLAYYKNGGVTPLEDKGGLMGMPLDGFKPLRVRLLNETQYKAVWGLANDADCDLNTDSSGLDNSDIVTTAGWPNSPAYKMYPVLIEVHWSEGTQSRKYQLKTIIANREQMD